MKNSVSIYITFLLIAFLVGCAPQGTGVTTTPAEPDLRWPINPPVYGKDAVVSQSDSLLFFRPVASLPKDRLDSVHQESVTLDVESPGSVQICAVDDRLDLVYTVEPDPCPTGVADADAFAEIGIYNHETKACQVIGRVQGATLLHLYSDDRYLVWCEATRSGVNLVDPTVHLYDRAKQTDVTWLIPDATIDNATEPSSFPPTAVLVAEDHVYMEVITGMSAEAGIRTAVYRYGILSGVLECLAVDAAQPYRLLDGSVGWCALTYDGSQASGIRCVGRNGTECGIMDPQVVLSRARLQGDVAVVSDFLQSWHIVSEDIEGLAPEAVDSSGIRMITREKEIPIIAGCHAVYVESPSFNGKAAVFRIEDVVREPLFYDIDGDRLIQLDDCPAAAYVPFVTDGKVIFVDGAYQPSLTREAIHLVWVEWP